MASQSDPDTKRSTVATQYHRRGFVVAGDLLPSTVIGPLRARVAAIAQGQVSTFPPADLEFEPTPNGGTHANAVRKINRCTEHDAEFMKVARDDSIMEIVTSLLGPDIKLFGSQCFMKPPGGIEKPYHQDSAYFPIAPTSLVTCWIALDDVTVQNGCLWVIPGSHHGPLHEHSDPWDLGGRIDKRIPEAKIDRTREVPIIMSAGSCSFHHSRLLHRSGPNLTQSDRRGLAIHYMSARSRWTDPNTRQPSYPSVRGKEYAGCV